MNTFSGQKCLQVESEFAAFLDFLKIKGVTSYLEIGCASGDTFHAVMSSLPPGCEGTAIDWPEKSWGIENSRAALERAVADLNEKGYFTQALFGSSIDPAIVKQAEGGAPYDAVFIDGDHTLAGVLGDFMAYAPLAGRIIALHDIANHGKKNKRGEIIDVALFWETIKKALAWKCEFAEFIEPGSEMGIGVMWEKTANADIQPSAS